MLKRMGIGVFKCLLKEVFEIAVQSVMAEHEDCRFYDNGSMMDSCKMFTGD